MVPAGRLAAMSAGNGSAEVSPATLCSHAAGMGELRSGDAALQTEVLAGTLPPDLRGDVPGSASAPVTVGSPE